jgi:hypothetical protein
MAVREPGVEALTGERNCVGARHPHEVEPERASPLREGGLEGWPL